MIDRVQDIRGRGNLTPSEDIYASLFERMHSEIVSALQQCPSHLMPINSIGCGGVVFSFLESIEWMRFENLGDFELYSRRLFAFPAQVDEFIAAMREGVRRGFVASAAVAKDVQAQVVAILEGDLPELNAPLNTESGIAVLDGEGEAAATATRLREGINGVKPALTKFLHFFVNEYTPQLRQDPACASLPGGLQAYALCLKFHTTTDLTAAQVHDEGLREVAKIEARYREDVMLPLGFDPDDFAAFVSFVRSDPQFYVGTAEALMDVYCDTCARIQATLPRFFNEIPKSPLEITSKQGGPAAYYLAGTADGKRPGRFYVNVSHIDQRPLYETMALSLHEAVPGHHHQISIGLENESIPNVM